MLRCKNIGSFITFVIVQGICNGNINYFYWRDWNDETFELACKELTREIKPEDDMERKEFRLTLVLSYFFKFMNQVKLFLGGKIFYLYFDNQYEGVFMFQFLVKY